MIDPLEDTHTRRVRDRRPTKAMRGCATRLSSLSLSFALKKSEDDEENIDASVSTRKSRRERSREEV